VKRSLKKRDNQSRWYKSLRVFEFSYIFLTGIINLYKYPLFYQYTFLSLPQSSRIQQQL